MAVPCLVGSVKRGGSVEPMRVYLATTGDGPGGGGGRSAHASGAVACVCVTVFGNQETDVLARMDEKTLPFFILIV